MAELKGKQERFCQEYLLDRNGTQAAIRAGYSKESARQQASRMLTNAAILARVRELDTERAQRMAVSQDYVISQLVETYNSCREAEPVLKFDPRTGQMKETGMYQFDSKGALKALELMGKHVGMFEKKKEAAAEGVTILDDL